MSALASQVAMGETIGTSVTSWARTQNPMSPTSAELYAGLAVHEVIATVRAGEASVSPNTTESRG